MSEEPEYHIANRLAGHANEVRGITPFSPIPNSFVSCSFDCNLVLWTPKEGEDGEYDMKVFDKEHTNYIVEVSEHGGKIFSLGHDKCLCVWDPKTGKLTNKKMVQEENGSALFINDRHIITGGWDYKSNVFTHDLEHVLELKGHKASVLAVCELDDGKFVTGCADGSIKIWKNGRSDRTISAHKLAVRSILVVPGVGFYTAANDGKVILWSITGEKLEYYVAHGHFIFRIRRLDEKRILTCSEDQSVKIWENQKCIQTLEHPSCIWDCCPLPNGDIAVACGNGNVYVWSTDPSRVVDEEVLKTTENDIYESKTKKSGVKVEDLAGEEALQVAGDKDGQIKMINVGGRGKVFQWNIQEKRWLMLGDLVDGPGSDKLQGKKEFEGKLYDFVFDVEVGEGGNMQKIGYNLGDDPWQVAKLFCFKHNLSMEFRDTIARFVVKNSGQDFYGRRKKTESVDPFARKSKQMLEEKRKKEKARETSHFPATVREEVSIRKWEPMWRKVESLNERVDVSLRMEKGEMDTLLSFLKNPNQEVKDGMMRTVLHDKFMKWPKDCLFPAIDTFSFLILRKSVRDYYELREDTPKLMPLFFTLFRTCFPLGGGQVEDMPVPMGLRITGMKLVCNMLAVKEMEKFLMLSFELIVRNTRSVLTKSQSDPLRLIGSKSLLNMSMLGLDENNAFLFLDYLVEMITEERKRVRTSKIWNNLMYIQLRALGTLLCSQGGHGGTVKKKCLEMGLWKNLVGDIQSEEAKVIAVKEQLYYFLK